MANDLSVNKIKAVLVAAGIAVHHDTSLGVLAVAPAQLPAVRALFAGQAHFLSWLSRDYRYSELFLNGSQTSVSIHRGPLSELSVDPVPYASLLKSTLDPAHAGQTLFMGANGAGSVLTDAYISAVRSFSGTNVSGYVRWNSSEPATIKRQSKVFGGLPAQRKALLTIFGYPTVNFASAAQFTTTAPSYPIDNVLFDSIFQDLPGGTYHKPNNDQPKNIDGSTGYGVLYGPKTRVNWVLVSGPACFTAGYSHPSGFGWIWVDNSDLADALERSEGYATSGVEELRLQIAKLRASVGGMGLIRGVASVNPFTLHPDTRLHAADLATQTGVADGLDFDHLAATWSTGAWMPFGGSSLESQEFLETLYKDSTWVLDILGHQSYALRRTGEGIASLPFATEAEGKDLVRKLAWGGAAAVQMGDNSTARADLLAPATAVLNEFLLPPAYVPAAASRFVGPLDTGYIGRTALPGLLQAKRSASHPAHAFCDPRFLGELLGSGL